eukprot:jgi/Botrbrau1/14350/Bobra.0014s0007.1
MSTATCELPHLSQRKSRRVYWIPQGRTLVRKLGNSLVTSLRCARAPLSSHPSLFPC